MVNSVFNFIVYGMLNKEFKKVFKSFFNCECYKMDMDVYKIFFNVVSRIWMGKFRLVVYKCVNDLENFSFEFENRCWKLSFNVVVFLVLRKKMFKWNKNDCKEIKDWLVVFNGYLIWFKNYIKFRMFLYVLLKFIGEDE